MFLGFFSWIFHCVRYYCYFCQLQTNLGMEKRYDVFISYSSEDQKTVEGICGYLERNGYQCFVAYRDIPSGVVWAKVIPDAIDASKMMVVVFSHSFNVSEQTDREIELASENHMPILTYRVADAKMTGAKKYYLKNLNWINAFPNPEKGFKELLNNVEKLISPSPLIAEESDKAETEYLTKETAKKEQLGCEKLATKQRVPLKKNFLPWIIAGVIVMITLITLFVMLTLPKLKPAVSQTDFVDLPIDVKGVSFVMKPIEGGTFKMGSTDSEACGNESPVHSVTVSAFYMGETEVTQALWNAVMDYNPSRFTGDNLPVEKVSYNEIVNDFLPKLNHETGKNFRLPTEAEWEYAARGGNRSSGYKYAGSNSVNDVAWYTVTTKDNGTRAVKTKLPNELGLYDMSGNVWEWCQEWYSEYTQGSQINPLGLPSGSSRVLRGGSWDDGAKYCRVSHRYDFSPIYGGYRIGFRLVLPQQ